GIPMLNPYGGGIGWDEYETSFKPMLRACLEAVGKEKILYIVFSFQVYQVVNGTPGSSTLALDSLAADVWDSFSGPWGTNPYSYYSFENAVDGYIPFVSLADYRDLSAADGAYGGYLVYSTWRLDGADPDQAKGLVDKAIQAETQGLSG